MEPQHNYTPGTSGMQQQIYGRKRSKRGCLAIGLIVLLVFGGAGTYLVYYLYNKTSGKIEEITDKFKDLGNKDKFIGSRNVDKRFEGGFIDAVIVPSAGSTPLIFLLTDGSKTYIETHKRPGYYSTGAACIDCKITAYLYDPAGDKIISSTDHSYPDIIASTDIALKDGKIYQFTRSYGETPAGVNIYEAVTGKLLTETDEFISSYPELGSGIIELSYRPEERIAKFETKDGRKDIIFSVDMQKMFSSDKELRTSIENSVDGESFIYAMANENNDSRRQLYRITAPKKFIVSQASTLMSYSDRPNMLRQYKAASEKVSDKSYIEGIIYAQDENNIYIVSADQAGKKANRLFTCIDAATGKEKWSVEQKELFDFMKIDEEQNSSQSFFSTKDKISVTASGNLVLLKVKGDGVMAFDTETGSKIWSIQPAPIGF
ncbi:MAG TPA: PQQ-binding-like beta-propeller repeat protein [Ignavibacteria bacterium]|nr:PQQ-binding-like beta-propeller repeat protein [Ignavibacteria bacterium]HMQ97493.1 PQQ-binding-like beta-propeller repeat protein [Ignavibacteria bacterium]